MSVWMLLLLLFIITQRIVEMFIAKSNEKWIKARGGIEKYPNHYKWFIIVHILFFISIIAEVLYKDRTYFSLNIGLLMIFILTQLGRVWCIQTLGRFWNTKIIILPGVSLIKKGPYKYIKHPNYIIVGLEFIVIPLLFKAYLTAIVFPILHIFLLLVRIPSEEKALNKARESSLEGDG